MKNRCECEIPIGTLIVKEENGYITDVVFGKKGIVTIKYE